jgi:hypothetical protein
VIDTLAAAAAARGREEVTPVRMLGHAERIAILVDLIDFDELHIPTTTPISAVCVPAETATGGGVEAYLSGAGVNARLGAMPGWRTTRLAGAPLVPPAAPAAAVALGLDAVGIESAIASAVLSAGGVNRAFGTIAKSLHLGFAVHAAFARRAWRERTAGWSLNG